MSTMTIAPSGSYVRARRAPGSTPRSQTPRRGSTLRLTRRGRVVVFLASLVGVFALGLTVAAGAGAALHRGEPEPTHTVRVAPGDTLWEIAAKAAQGGDIRSMEHHIMELNGLSSGALQVGVQLRVPGN
jgi:hypothetical protein